MKRISTKAIILRRINYEEADRIITAITPDHGKVSLYAKGVRKSGSKLAGGLELFSVSDIVLIEGKGTLKTIISARLDRHFGHVTEDISVTMLAYEFLKLIDDHTQEQCEQDFFLLLERGLSALHARQPKDLVELWFLAQLLRASGRAVNVEAQVSGEPFKEDVNYMFDHDAMGFSVHKNGQYGPQSIKFLRLMFKVQTPVNVLKVQDAEALTKQLLPLLRASIQSG